LFSRGCSGLAGLWPAAAFAAQIGPPDRFARFAVAAHPANTIQKSPAGEIRRGFCFF